MSFNIFDGKNEEERLEVLEGSFGYDVRRYACVICDKSLSNVIFYAHFKHTHDIVGRDAMFYCTTINKLVVKRRTKKG